MIWISTYDQSFLSDMITHPNPTFYAELSKTPLKMMKNATHHLCRSLRWRHNGRDIVPNHQPHDCLLNCLFRCRSKKTSKLRATGLCVGNSPGTGEFPAQMASYAENVSIWWRHHGYLLSTPWFHGRFSNPLLLKRSHNSKGAKEQVKHVKLIEPLNCSNQYPFTWTGSQTPMSLTITESCGIWRHTNISFYVDK